MEANHLGIEYNSITARNLKVCKGFFSVKRDISY